MCGYRVERVALPTLLLMGATDGDGRGAVKTRQAEGYTEITVAPVGRSADDPIEELPTPFAAPQARLWMQWLCLTAWLHVLADTALTNAS